MSSKCYTYAQDQCTKETSTDSDGPPQYCREFSLRGLVAKFHAYQYSKEHDCHQQGQEIVWIQQCWTTKNNEEAHVLVTRYTEPETTSSFEHKNLLISHPSQAFFLAYNLALIGAASKFKVSERIESAKPSERTLLQSFICSCSFILKSVSNLSYISPKDSYSCVNTLKNDELYRDLVQVSGFALPLCIGSKSGEHKAGNDAG